MPQCQQGKTKKSNRNLGASPSKEAPKVLVAEILWWDNLVPKESPQLITQMVEQLWWPTRCVRIVKHWNTQRKFQQTPGTYPRPSTTCLWRKCFHVCFFVFFWVLSRSRFWIFLDRRQQHRISASFISLQPKIHTIIRWSQTQNWRDCELIRNYDWHNIRYVSVYISINV